MAFALIFVFCLLLGVPVFATLGIPTVIELLTSPIPLAALAHSLFDGVDKFPLLAIPCFVLAGALMSRAGITEDIINVMRAIVGKVHGGLAIVTILSCMFFAAISGSGPGTVAAIGTLLIPAMVQDGYRKDFAAAVASSGGTLGILLPPSNPMIVYGVLGEVSITKLFLADPVFVGQTTTLQFTISNTSTLLALSGLSFVDNLPAGLIVASPANAATTCTGEPSPQSMRYSTTVSSPGSFTPPRLSV